MMFNWLQLIVFKYDCVHAGRLVLGVCDVQCLYLPPDYIYWYDGLNIYVLTVLCYCNRRSIYLKTLKELLLRAYLMFI